MLLENEKYYKEFNRTIKIINLEWESSGISESVNSKGEHFLSCSIITNYGRNPTMEECITIADYLKVVYHKGYFYKKIIN